MLSVRRLAASEWPAYRDLRLRALADAPHAFGSLLEYEQPRTDADWQERVAAGANSSLQLPIIALSADAPVGLAWGRIEPTNHEVAKVYQMWVAPDHRGRGIGRMLLDALTAWAHATGARYVELSVTVGDSPAARLYSRAGFRPAGELGPLRSGSTLLSQPLCLDLQRPV